MSDTANQLLDIREMSVKNFKGVIDVTIAPAGNLVILSGANGAGKSSFIDAICEIIDPKGIRLHSKPIRDGETEAVASITTDQWTATRTWKGDGRSTLSIIQHEGKLRWKTPAEALKKIVGSVAFDPTEFIYLGEREQKDTLVSLVDLPFDPAELDAQKTAAEERRLIAKRDVDRLASVQSSLTRPAKGAPTEKVTTSSLLAEIDRARAHNSRRRDAQIAVDEAIGYCNETARKIAELQEELTGQHAAVEAKKDSLADLKPEIDLAPLEAQLDDVAAVNTQIEKNAEWARVAEQHAAAAAAAKQAQDDLDTIAKQKADGLASVEFPVAGLGFDDTGVTYTLADGAVVPFKQLNTRHAYLASARIMMRLGKNAQLRIMAIRNGSLIDSEGMAVLEQIAADEGYTVLLEKVDESGQIGVVFHEGTADGAEVLA